MSENSKHAGPIEITPDMIAIGASILRDSIDAGLSAEQIVYQVYFALVAEFRECPASQLVPPEFQRVRSAGF